MSDMSWTRDPEATKRFAWWSSMTDADRRVAGEPETQVDYAEVYGVAMRTLERWKAKPQFDALVAEFDGARERRVASRTAPDPDQAAAQLVGDDDESAAEADYASRAVGLLDRLLGIAETSADPKTLQDTLKVTQVGSLVKSALDQAETDFATLADDELDAQLAAHLRARGWSCSPPDAAVARGDHAAALLGEDAAAALAAGEADAPVEGAVDG